MTEIDLSSIKWPTISAKDLGYAEDWTYRDIPALSWEMWDTFLDILGDGNFAVVAMTIRTGPHASKRGQFVISPKGMENLLAFAKEGQPNAS